MDKARSLALTSADNMLMFIEYFQEHHIAWQQEAEQFGLPLDLYLHKQWIPIESFSLFVNAMQLKLRDEALGAKIGFASGPSFCLYKADDLDFDKTLESLLLSMMNNSAQMSRHVSYWIDVIDKKWCLCHRGNIKPSFPGYAQIEWFRVSLLITILRRFLGLNWLPSKIYMMTHPHQGGSSEALLRPCKLSYSHNFSAIELPLPRDFKPFSYSIKTHKNMEEITLLAETYAHLPIFSAEWLASLFGITRRTLHRYLQEHNCNFREVKEAARYKIAREVVTETSDSIETIAFNLGYSDIANFNRAFKSWSGITPVAFRRTNKSL